jgi:hypothetical protein
MKTLTIDSKPIELYWFTGSVVGASKNLETRVTGGGGGGQNGYSAPVSIRSTTTVHDQLFLVDRSGTERAFQLSNFDVACRESHNVSVVWAMKKGAKEGPYILVHNHTTGDASFKNDKLRALLLPSTALYWAITLLATLLAIWISNGYGFLILAGIIVWSMIHYRKKIRARIEAFHASFKPAELLAN